MHITISEELAEMLRSVGVVTGTSRINELASAMITQKCVAILDAARKEASLQPQPAPVVRQYPDPSQISNALRKEASYSTFDNQLGPEINTSQTQGMSRGPSMPEGDHRETPVNFQQPGEGLIQRIK